MMMMIIIAIVIIYSKVYYAEGLKTKRMMAKDPVQGQQ